MWNKYEPPSEQQPDEPQPEEAAGRQPGEPQPPASWPRLGEAPPHGSSPLPQPLPRRFHPPTGGRHIVTGPSKSASPAAALIGIVGMIAAVGIGVGAAGSSSSDPGPSQEQLEREAWDECIASYRGEDTGLLSPADLCEIGNERPDDYYEYEDEGSIFDDDCEYTYLECEDSYLDDYEYSYP